MLDRLRAGLVTLRSVFLSGLFTIIPIAATLFFINFLYTIVSKMLIPLERIEPNWLYVIPGSEFVIVMLVILTIGIILKTFLMSKIVHYFEGLVNRIPLVRIVYSAAKILVDFFKVSDVTIAMQRRVVLIPYPKKGQYHLAFLLESAEENYQPIIPEKFKHYAGEKYVKVFMPNSPNPTSGYFFIMPEDEVILTDISFEEAVKSLVSCGLITPESLLKKP
jgi:uncharacterized membrane protein